MKTPLGLSLLFIALPHCIYASSGTWNLDSAGNWSDLSKWHTGIVADGIDSQADFDGELSADRTITNNAGTGGWSGTIGHLRFNDLTPSHQWVVSGGSLALSVSSHAPTIDVVSGTASIGSSITGTQGFIKSGSGTLTLTSANSYSGDTIINAGRIYLGTATGSIVSSVVTVNHGGVLEIGTDGISDHYGDSLGLKLKGGTLQFGRSTSTGINRETIGALSFSGNSTILFQRANSSSDRLALTVASFSREDRGILTIRGNTLLGDIAGTGSERFQVSAATAPTVINGMIGAEYVSEFVGNAAPYHYLTYEGSGTTGWLRTATYTGISNSADFVTNYNNTNAIANVGNTAITSNVETFYVALRTPRNISGSGKINLSSGGLLLHGAVTSISNSIDFGNEAIVYAAATNAVTLSGTLTASNGFTKGGKGTLVITSTSNNFGSGPITINEGILQIGGANNRLPTNSGLSVRHEGTFDLNGFSQSVANLKGEGTVTNGAASTSSVFIVGNTEDGAFSGIIEDGLGTLALTKNGTGVLDLSGNNSYTGATIVNAGTLLINGDQSAATGAVTVGVNAILGGSGTIGGATTIEGALKPGNSEGLLTFSSSLTLAAGSVTTLEIGSDAMRGGTYDAVNVEGLLTYGGDLVLSINGTQPGGTWNLFGFGEGLWDGAFQSVTLTGFYNGSLTLSDSVWTGTVDGQEWLFDQSTGMLTIPEPSTWAMLGLGAAAFSLPAWRRKRWNAGV